MWTKISMRVDQLLVICDIPRGAKVASSEYIKHLAKLYEEIEKTFDFINERAFPGFWPIRDMVIQKCANQRAYDSAKKRAKENGETVSQHRKRVQEGRSEDRAVSNSPSRSPSPLPSDPSADQDSHRSASPVPSTGSDVQHAVSPAKGKPKIAAKSDPAPDPASEDQEDDMYASEQQADNGLPPKFIRWAKCGPLIANIVFDAEQLKLPKEWANYQTEKDRACWEGVDDEMEEEIYGKGFPHVDWWLPYFEERFSSHEEFEIVWKEFCEDYLEVEDPRRARHKRPKKSKPPKREETPAPSADEDAYCSEPDPLSDLSSLPASPEPKKRQKLDKVRV
ncbi:hypothetical protein H1R20_g13889, partial [Candolleomyces eurysporus]